MSATNSTMLELGTALPPFRLSRLGGGEVASSDFDGAPALLVVFICPHCPFMKHIRRELGRFSRDYLPRGLAMVSITCLIAAAMVVGLKFVRQAEATARFAEEKADAEAELVTAGENSK